MIEHVIAGSIPQRGNDAKGTILPLSVEGKGL